MDVVINDKRKIIIHGIAYWIRVKEFDAWVPDFEDDDDSLSSGEDAPIFNNDIEDSEVDKVSETSFIQEFDHVLNSVHDEAPQSKAAEALPNEETPPSTSDQEKPKEDPVQVSSNCAHPSSSRTRESKKNRGMTSFPNSHSGSFKQKAGGSIIDLMDELVNVGRAMGYKMDGCLGNKAKRRWINGLCHKHRINFMSLQETKMEDIDVCTIKEVWGNMYFDHVVGPSVGFSGALLFKWVWRFFSDGSSLWSTFIKALFGFHGAIGLTVKPNRRSIWSDILQAVNSLKDKEKFPRLYALEESKSISVADKLGLLSIYLSFAVLSEKGNKQRIL
ncbi:hypothetical protein Tco_0848869 [Tanacetum coccineum]